MLKYDDIVTMVTIYSNVLRLISDGVIDCIISFLEFCVDAFLQAWFKDVGRNWKMSKQYSL